MSQPPTSSPSTNSCGIVGQFESADSSWRIRGSGRMSTAANGWPTDWRIADRAGREAARGLIGCALHEQDHRVLRDRLWIASRMGLVAPRSWVSFGDLWSGREGVDAVAELGAEDVIDEPVLGDAAQPAERGRARPPRRSGDRRR